MLKRLLLCAALLGADLAVPIAFAADATAFPNKPVRIVVPQIVKELLRGSAVAASFAAQGAEPAPASPEAFARLLQAHALKWGAQVD